MSKEKEVENIKVAVRCRPMSTKEKANGENSIFSIQDGNACLQNPADPNDLHKFNFDLIFGLDSRQESVWEAVGAPILTKAFSGYNATIFAYGQTGSGKTFSMQGLADPPELRGIIPRMNNSLFEQISEKKAASDTCLFLVTCSYFEIYNEIIFDLLDPDNRKKKGTGLSIKEHSVLGIYVQGLQEIVVESPKKMQDLIDQGMASRTVASTNMNDTSSRSHSVFTIKIHQKDVADESKNLFAKINLVDLAGSERADRTGASGAVLKEGANINKSLSALGNVINALVELAKGKKKTFVPYRNSKLTRVLQESLGGNSLTSMLAALSPAACNFDETIGTLKYASRAKTIKVNAVKNEEASQIAKLNEEIELLRQKLMEQAAGSVSAEAEERYKQQLSDLDAALKSTWEDKAKLSEAHELERQKLAREQEEAKAQLQEERSRRWRLLEEKGDLEMSLREVSEVLETLPLDKWMSQVRLVLQQEKAAKEQETVVNVYNTALADDISSLSSKVADAHRQDLTGIRQLKFRMASLEQELRKMFQTHDSLLKAMADLIGTVHQFRDEWKLGKNIRLSKKYSQSQLEESDIQDENTAIMIKEKEQQRKEEGNRALSMFSRQTKKKRQQLMNQVSVTNQSLKDLATFAQSIVSNLSESKSSEPGSPSNKRGSRIEEAALPAEEVRQLGELRAAAIDSLRSSIAQTEAAFSQMQPPTEMNKDVSAASLAATQASDQDDAQSPNNQPASSLMFGDKQRVKVFASSDGVTGSGTALDIGKKSFGKPWIVLPDSCDKKKFLQVDLGQEMEVTAIVTVGGSVLIPSPLQDANTPSKDTPVSEPTSSSPSESPASSVLVAGKGLADVNEDFEQTATMLGEIFAWEDLIKTPPQKLLSRPPVKFLYDLFVKVSTETGYLADLIASTNFENMSNKKDKTLFMDQVIAKVVADLQLQASPAAGSNIVSGSECGQTNKFLQLLALSARMLVLSKSSTTAKKEVVQVAPTPSNNQAPEPSPVPAWVSKYKVLLSCDGVNWNTAEGSPFKGNKDSNQSTRRELSSPGLARYVRLQPTRWEQCIVLEIDIEGRARPAPKGAEESKSAEPEVTTNTVLVQSLLELINGMKQGIEAVLMKAQAYEKLEQLKTKLKKEKMQSLTNEKDKLEAQLSQANEERDQLQDENTKLNETLLSFEAEKLELKNQLLKLQVEAEKLRTQNEGMSKSLEALEAKVVESDEHATNLQKQNQMLAEAKEELGSQIEVLTEERDVARVHEEELFRTLSEKQQDLEELQESYVNMTDRCNDFQDYIADLEEKLEGVQSFITRGNKSYNELPSGIEAQMNSSCKSGAFPPAEAHNVNGISTQAAIATTLKPEMIRPEISTSFTSPELSNEANNTEEDYDDDFEENEEDKAGNNASDRIAVGSPLTGRSKSTKRPESAHRSGRHASFNNINSV